MRTLLMLAIILPMMAACTQNSGPGGTARVNGSVHVVAGQANGDVATVNGAISIDDKANFGTADTVNGDIWVGAGATGRSAKTVNGGVTLDHDARLSADVGSVNGSLTLNAGATATGAVSNVNGTITINDATVNGGIATVNGDINVNGHSHIRNGILVHKLSMGILQAAHDDPRIIIGPGASVEGTLRFERKVRLYVSDHATIGPVDGATPVSFSGDKPAL